MAPSVAAPAMHAMPAAPAAGAHAAAPAHGAPSVHGAPIHTGHGAVPSARTVTSHKAAGSPGSTHPPSSGTNHPNRPFPFYPYPTNLLPGVSDNFASGYPVPGLGFDYAHFFAVHPNWGRLHPVDGVLLSWGGYGGFYMPVPYYTESTPQEEEEEQAVSNQQPVSSPQVIAEEPSTPARSRGGSYMSAEPVPEFVFVKHDGSTFSAVAYSWTKDKLQYVTKDGLRRSTGIETLDIPATERMNEERGNTVNFPKSLVSSVALSIEAAPLR